MRALVKLVLLALAIQLSGCAAHPDPIIDTKGVDPEELAQDWDECEVYTEEIVVAMSLTSPMMPRIFSIAPTASLVSS